MKKVINVQNKGINKRIYKTVMKQSANFVVSFSCDNFFYTLKIKVKKKAGSKTFKIKQRGFKVSVNEKYEKDTLK